MTDVDLIKSKIDIVDFLSSFLTLKKAGRNFKALCPFHSEKTPSFIISPERQSWHCFGACATGGDVISFYQKWEGIDFLEALKSLAEKTKVTLQKFTPDKDSLIKEKIYAINNFAADFFQFLLTSHSVGKRALDYLRSRQIKKEIINSFQLGYAPESWDSLYKYILKKGYSPDELENAGLVIRSDRGKYYDRFRGRIIFTLKDPRGKIIGFSGRLIPPSADKQPAPGSPGEAGAKYINSPETPVYVKGNSLYGLDLTREFIKKADNAVIVEGEFDMLSSYQSGITNVVAIKGSALTQNQVLLLKRFTPEISLALDSDFAGNQAAKRGIEIAENAGLNVKVVKLLSGKDPAECVQAAPHLWKKSVAGSIPIYDFIISSSAQKYDIKDPIGKKKMSEEVIPFLSKISNPIISSHYIKKLAEMLNVSEESIETSVTRYVKKENVGNITAVENNVKKERSELLEEYFLSVLLHSEHLHQLLEKALNIVALDDFEVPSIRTILHLLQEYLSRNKKFDIKDFNKMITPEITSVFDRAYLLEFPSTPDTDKFLQREIDKSSREIKKLILRRKITELSTKLNRLEEEKKTNEINALNREIKKLITNIKEIEK